MKMWSGEDAFCLALIFVGSTTLLKIEFLNWNTTENFQPNTLPIELWENWVRDMRIE